jgi:hypothetical protein
VTADNTRKTERRKIEHDQFREKVAIGARIIAWIGVGLPPTTAAGTLGGRFFIRRRHAGYIYAAQRRFELAKSGILGKLAGR